MTLRFGLLWPFRNPEWARMPWEQLYRSHLDLIVDSERMGFDEAWLTEHHFIEDGYSPSLLPIGSAIAARTHRIRIGTFLLLLPLHNPVRVAEDTATLDVISGGRFDLGVGLGYRPGEFDDQGIPASERAARMQENLTIVRRLLSGEAVTIDGKYNRLSDVRISPPAFQRPHPPMWVGGTAPKALSGPREWACTFSAAAQDRPTSTTTHCVPPGTIRTTSTSQRPCPSMWRRHPRRRGRPPRGRCAT
jgi:alkanesulfonate monooxygenase SsuD/methylene tetrahydromethanopterin reductase-like flavin-dependent oxidoreductase (luciferase family)